jgi:class 3 adenylate cyclase
VAPRLNHRPQKVENLTLPSGRKGTARGPPSVLTLPRSVRAPDGVDCRDTGSVSVDLRSHDMGELPTGTVTFLFTDIEGSTRLPQTLGEEWKTVLEDHNRLVWNAIREASGFDLRTEGDSFFETIARLRLAEEIASRSGSYARMGLRARSSCCRRRQLRSGGVETYREVPRQ